MRQMPDEVIKAETDAEILDALQGVKLMQTELRDGRGTGMTLAFLAAYYEKLPTGVTRRLTEIDAETLRHIGPVTGYGLHGEQMKPLADKLAGDAAFAQVPRASQTGGAHRVQPRGAGGQGHHPHLETIGGRNTMNNEQKQEIIKALAYGKTPEEIAAAERVSSQDVRELEAAQADAIAQAREEYEKGGFTNGD